MPLTTPVLFKLPREELHNIKLYIIGGYNMGIKNYNFIYAKTLRHNANCNYHVNEIM